MHDVNNKKDQKRPQDLQIPRSGAVAESMLRHHGASSQQAPAQPLAFDHAVARPEATGTKRKEAPQGFLIKREVH